MVRITDRLDVSGADALLIVGEPFAAGMIAAQDIGYQWMHACSGEKHRRIVLGNQGSPTDLHMVFRHKKVNEFLP